MTYNKDWISKWAIYTPNKTAIKEYDTGRSITYHKLNNMANHLAKRLKGLGLKKGDRIMILADHCLEYVVLFSVAQKTGIILVPVNYRLAPAEIGHLIKDCEPGMLIIENKYEHKINAITASRIKIRWTMSDLRAFCEQEQHQVPNNTVVSTPIKEGDPVFILYTSGTTGFPKGALYTHKMLFWNSLNTSLSLETTSRDQTITCMPPFHTGGWNVLLTPFLHRGAQVGLLKKFDADRILQLLESEQSNVFMGVPTMLKMMMDSKYFDQANFTSIRYFIVGGESLPLPVIRQWHKKGVKIRQGYGLTEVGPNLTSLHQDDAIKKIGSIGRPNFYLETKLVNELGQEVGINEIGEFCLKGNVVTPGYWKNEKATKEAIIDGWFHTGDLMKKDEEGYLYVMDRKKNMFISGGENVFPAEVERLLLLHPEVSEVAVIGVPDSKWGEVGKAFIVTNNKELNCDELYLFCEQKMARFKIPKYFQFIEQLPKNDTGKINKNLLKSR